MKKSQFHKNLEIERLRAVAVIMVTVTHGILSNVFPTFMLLSFYGVDLFFAISGYVVTFSLFRLLPTQLGKNWKTRVTHHTDILYQFYLKRIFRIVPLSTTWMIIYLFMAVYFEKIGGRGNIPPAFSILTDILGVFSGFYNYLVSYGLPGSISHYWSLATEMQFYTVLQFCFFSLLLKKYVQKPLSF